MKILHAVDSTFVLERSSLKKHWEMQGERKATPHLQCIERVLGGVLDHTATLIYNLSLQDGAIQAPLALVNPSGVTLFYLDHRRGVFRAKGGEWEQLDKRYNQYRPSQPNPLSAAVAQVDALRTYLAEQDFPKVSIQAVILFTDPGIHIEGEGGEVRLIYMDGFSRFAAALARAQPTMTVNEVHTLVSILAPYTLEEALTSQEIHDEFSFREERPPQVQIPQINLPLPSDDKLVGAIRKVPFTQRQLLMIAVLVVVNILVLIALILVILALS